MNEAMLNSPVKQTSIVKIEYLKRLSDCMKTFASSDQYRSIFQCPRSSVRLEKQFEYERARTQILRSVIDDIDAEMQAQPSPHAL